jgi:hypothetical protein
VKKALHRRTMSKSIEELQLREEAFTNSLNSTMETLSTAAQDGGANVPVPDALSSVPIISGMSLTNIEFIAAGHFGLTFKATWLRDKNGAVDVVIKRPQKESGKDEWAEVSANSSKL